MPYKRQEVKGRNFKKKLRSKKKGQIPKIKNIQHVNKRSLWGKKKTKKKILKTKTQANFLKIESNYQTYYSLLEKFNPEQTVP